jgi:hypothetical protein
MLEGDINSHDTADETADESLGVPHEGAYELLWRSWRTARGAAHHQLITITSSLVSSHTCVLVHIVLTRDGTYPFLRLCNSIYTLSNTLTLCT